MNCVTCGCYVPELTNICPACSNEPNVKVIEKIVYKTVEKPAEGTFDYISFFNNEPMVKMTWIDTPKGAPEKFEKLKLILIFIISQYPPFYAMDIPFIKANFKAVSEVNDSSMEYALNNLVKDGIIDKYQAKYDHWHSFYARLPKTNEEVKRKKKHYNRKTKKYLVSVGEKIL